MKNFKAFFLAFLAVFTAATILQAGVVVTTVENFSGKDKEENKAYFDQGRLRMETRHMQEDQIMIFRGDKDLLWVIDMNRKEYTEMTREDVAKMKEQMDNAVKMLEEQLKNVPPEQREMIKKMMPGGADMQTPAKTVYKKVAGGVKVNKWTCDKYEGYTEGKKTDEVWSADWSEIGIASEKFNAMRNMTEFFDILSEQIGDFMMIGDEEYAKSGGYPGMPVKMIHYTETEQHIFEIKEIREQALDQSLFELPSGFKKKDLPTAGMRSME